MRTEQSMPALHPIFTQTSLDRGNRLRAAGWSISRASSGRSESSCIRHSLLAMSGENRSPR